MGTKVTIEDAQSFGQISALEGGIGRLRKSGIAVLADEALHAGIDVVVAEVKNAEGHLLAFKGDVRCDAGAAERHASAAGLMRVEFLAFHGVAISRHVFLIALEE